MVRRRSTVRFRNETPVQRGFSNIGSQDQVTNQVMRLQLTGGAARRTQTPMPLWIAAIRLNATASDKTARHCQEKVRIRPLPVSVSWRTASASRARRAGPVGHAAWKPCSRLRVGDCSALAESDQRTDPRRAPGIGESAGIRIVHLP